MRLIQNLKLYEPHRPSCMTLIDCMRTKLIHEVYMSLIENVCAEVVDSSTGRLSYHCMTPCEL